MTKKELEQYRSIVAEIEEVQDRLNEKTVYDTVTGSDIEYPYVKHNITVVGLEPSANSHRDMLLIQNLESRKRDIEQFIYNIPDSITRRIFTYRYIEGAVKPSWQWIAFKVDHYDESYPRKKHNKFLKNFSCAEKSEN